MIAKKVCSLLLKKENLNGQVEPNVYVNNSNNYNTIDYSLTGFLWAVFFYQ